MKRLLFAAVLATLAAGGAYATSSQSDLEVYDGAGNPVDCSIGTTECTDQQYYSDPNQQFPVNTTGLFRD